MSFRLSPAVSKILGRMSGSAKSVAQTSNTAMDAMADTLDPRQAPMFVEGTIERTGPGVYDATVAIPGYAPVGCNFLAHIASNLYGASECILPVAGSRVLVYLPSRRSLFGTIIGVIPAHDTASTALKGKPPEAFVSFWELEANATGTSEDGYAEPIRSKQFMCTVNSGAARPLDLMPGSHAIVNDQGAGIAVTALAATMKATSKAQIRCGVVDDNVRIVAGFFQMFGPDGTLQAFNDNGYVTEERGVTSYQCERSGMDKIGEPVFQKGQTKTLNAKSLFTSMDNKSKRMVPRRRLSSLLGFMGDIFNLFVANPDPDAELPETEDAETKDQGLLHVHADTSGRLQIRAANGILLQRSDRIPVPKRLRQPWDPEGDKDIQEPEEKKPFEWDKEHPYGRSLQFRDACAWHTRAAYWHIHNQSTSTGHKDYYLPEERDLDVPADEYDKTGKATENFAAYDKRQAAFSIEPDGSLLFRDAWGSEVIMRGGNIIFNCAGNVEIKTGKSTTIMAGHDVVVKARQSVDVTATEKDMRLQCKKNMHMHAKGVLVESSAQGDALAYEEVKGEEVVSSGIVLKAKDSRVLTLARRTHITASTAVMLETFGENGVTGDVLVSARDVRLNAENDMLLTTGSQSGVHIGSSGIQVASPNTAIIGSGGAAVVQGEKAMVPLDWADVGDVYGPVQGLFQTQYDMLSKVDWLMPYDPETRSGIIFTYRTSEQYGTLSATEIEGGTGFYVYQPFWAFMAKRGAKTVPKRPVPWQEYEIEGTYPWPGKEARENAYVTLPNELNVESDTGISKDRQELQAEGAALETGKFELEVIPH